MKIITVCSVCTLLHPDIMTLLATIIIIFIANCSSAEAEAGVGAGVEERFLFGNPLVQCSECDEVSVGCDWTLQDGAVAGCGLSAPPPAPGGTAPPPAREGAVAQIELPTIIREASQCPASTRLLLVESSYSRHFETSRCSTCAKW